MDEVIRVAALGLVAVGLAVLVLLADVGIRWLRRRLLGEPV
jgi:hypothetical protein